MVITAKEVGDMLKKLAFTGVLVLAGLAGLTAPAVADPVGPCGLHRSSGNVYVVNCNFYKASYRVTYAIGGPSTYCLGSKEWRQLQTVLAPQTATYLGRC